MVAPVAPRPLRASAAFASPLAVRVGTARRRIERMPRQSRHAAVLALLAAAAAAAAREAPVDSIEAPPLISVSTSPAAGIVRLRRRVVAFTAIAVAS